MGRGVGPATTWNGALPRLSTNCEAKQKEGKERGGEGGGRGILTRISLGARKRAQGGRHFVEKIAAPRRERSRSPPSHAARVANPSLSTILSIANNIILKRRARVPQRRGNRAAGWGTLGHAPPSHGTRWAPPPQIGLLFSGRSAANATVFMLLRIIMFNAGA